LLIAHISDSHLGYRQYGLIERERDLYACFEEALSRAVEEHVDLVVHSGDLFHSPSPPPQAYRSAMRALKVLKQRGIPFLYVMGQHDRPKTQALAPTSVLEDMDLLMHVSDKPYVSGEYSVVGLDYARRQALKEKLQSSRPLTKKSVLAMHVLLKEVSPLGELSINEVPKGFTYYALGDYHIFKTFKVHGSVAAYPGSCEIISLNDLTEVGKGFCFVDLSGDEASVEFQKLESVRPRIVAEVAFDDLKSLVAKIVSQAVAMKLKPLIHLTVKGVGVRRKDLDKVREELLSVSLRAFISIEELEVPLLSTGRASFGGVEEVISSLLPDMSNTLIELYRAFRAGDLRAELERLFNSGEWLRTFAQQPSEKVPSKPPKTAPSTKAKSSTILGWLTRDNRED